MKELSTHIVREASIAGADLREVIAFEPQWKVTFFLLSAPRQGAIINELFEDAYGAFHL